MKFAYADPPYIGQAALHYADHPDYGGEVDHAALIAMLVAEYPDGWALSLSSPTLREVLNLCQDAGARAVRVGAWVKPFASFKPGVNPAYAWEPVIFCGGRKLGRDTDTVRDWVSANITMQRGTHGAKPIEFCFWVFDFLGLQSDDELIDLFPGSRAVSWAWESYRAQPTLFAPKSVTYAISSLLVSSDTPHTPT